MKLREQSILSHSTPGTARATLTFPGLTALSNGTVLATYRIGSTKDSADGCIECCRSIDGGFTWSQAEQLFTTTQVDGKQGSLRVCYVTELAPGHLIAASLWVDRESYPDRPLFNPETEGCLPMAILLADSHDFGLSWTPWHAVPLPDEIGPPSLTDRILRLGDGRLALSIETNKPYLDPSPWLQRVVLLFSDDQGQTWSAPVTSGQDPSGRIFNWDQRLAVAPDGHIVAFAWTYDNSTGAYINIHRRISADNGHTWSEADDLGFADQPAHPAILADGRVVLVWVDRYRTRSIRARPAVNIKASFDAAREVVLYTHGPVPAAHLSDDNTGALLAEMTVWSFGLPHAEALPDGRVLVVYYAGSETAMDIHWCLLEID